MPDEDIHPLISNAKLFVFPSLYEGFGIPLLDAQVCQIPVVSSNAGSLPEVGGDGVLYFDPENITEITEMILKVINDNQLSKAIVAKGLENREKFSWQNTAKQTIDVYNEILLN